MKRSRSIALVMMGAGALTLAACDEAPVDANVFETLDQCRQASGADPEVCAENYRRARDQHAEAAPKYTDKAACEADFGSGNCETAPYQTQGGGSVFMPLMMGYMMGRMMGGGAAAQPLYRSADDPKNFRTADNRRVGSTIGATKVSGAAAAAPAAKRYTMSRGGFGARAGSLGTAGG